ncbi:glycosyltransferase [Lichenibacterium minor]|uniref:Glycosyltransferase n=1 Tax=Lichenibacterium minor TaxID=2316528 RepID=A0A4Q2UEG3_9HYPH|nr:glycosyltransferase [Lichenibacterium minor]RYC33617.1 glycosyltransferase [Lichenibacterium minor]
MSGPDAPRRRPRVLVVHNGYQIRGGEEAAVERDVAALRGTGIAVELLLVHNDEIETGLDRLRVALEAPHAPRGIARVMAAVARFRPDIVHVHNTFPLVSPGVHAAVRAAGAATVQTLHNYRVTCANGMLTRDGHPCEDCVGRSPYRAVLHACYRGSRIGSLAVARTIDRHRLRGTWHRDVDRFIALTPFAKGRFVAAGLPSERIAVRPNSYPDPGPPSARPRAGLLYVGRLVAEKGLAVLAEAARGRDTSVTVMGEGPMAAALAGRPGLDLAGSRDAAAVRAAMAGAAAVVVPSLWYEGLPNVIVEAFAAGTPVVASRIGSLADVVEDGETGLLVDPGDAGALAAALRRIEAAPDEARRMGAKARAAYESRWTERVAIDALLAIYAEASASRKTRETIHGT